MTTTAKLGNYARWLAIFVFTASLAVVSGNAIAADDEVDVRVSITTQSSRVQRDAGIAGIVSEDEFAQLRTRSEASKSVRQSSLSTSESASARAANVDFWFYTADVELFSDRDRDGYYHGIDLLFDADTYFTFADVYAVVYLSFEGGPWNEYAATEDFTIFGATSDDDYVIVTELVSGYPTGSYDILIELFDAYDDTFLAYYGPDDTSELAFLPLEDADRDIEIIPEVIVVNRHHGGGSFGLISILLIGLAGLSRHRRRQAEISG